MEKRFESSQTENGSVVVEAVRLYQKGDQYNYKYQPPKESAAMTWLKQYKRTLKDSKKSGSVCNEIQDKAYTKKKEQGNLSE